MRIFTIWRFNRLRDYLNRKTSIYRHITPGFIRQMSKDKYREFKRQLSAEENWIMSKE